MILHFNIKMQLGKVNRNKMKKTRIKSYDVYFLILSLLNKLGLMLLLYVSIAGHRH
jgi:hypothetical protein